MLARQILASFAVDVDVAPLSKLDQQINKLKGQVKSFSVMAGASFAAAGYTAYKFVKEASHVTEVLNVLDVAFKGNTASVVRWSTDTAAAMSRSTFDMQETMAKFGAFLNPQFKNSTVNIEEMSQSLSKLAVDLNSFYDIGTDAEAVRTLFSGLQGETEMVRKFGIDISDEALEQYNREVVHDNRRMRALSLREKTLLRYRKILLDTEQAQGDAVKTADSYANRERALQGKWKDFSVAAGQALLPLAHQLLDLLTPAIQKLGEVVKWLSKHSEAVGDALKLVVAGFAVMAARRTLTAFGVLVQGFQAIAVASETIAAADAFGGLAKGASAAKTALGMSQTAAMLAGNLQTAAWAQGLGQFNPGLAQGMIAPAAGMATQASTTALVAAAVAQVIGRLSVAALVAMVVDETFALFSNRKGLTEEFHNAMGGKNFKEASDDFFSTMWARIKDRMTGFDSEREDAAKQALVTREEERAAGAAESIMQGGQTGLRGYQYAKLGPLKDANDAMLAQTGAEYETLRSAQVQRFLKNPEYEAGLGFKADQTDVGLPGLTEDQRQIMLRVVNRIAEKRQYIEGQDEAAQQRGDAWVPMPPKMSNNGTYTRAADGSRVIIDLKNAYYTPEAIGKMVSDAYQTLNDQAAEAARQAAQRGAGGKAAR